MALIEKKHKMCQTVSSLKQKIGTLINISFIGFWKLDLNLIAARPYSCRKTDFPVFSAELFRQRLSLQAEKWAEKCWIFSARASSRKTHPCFSARGVFRLEALAEKLESVVGDRKGASSVVVRTESVRARELCSRQRMFCDFVIRDKAFEYKFMFLW